MKIDITQADFDRAHEQISQWEREIDERMRAEKRERPPRPLYRDDALAIGFTLGLAAGLLLAALMHVLWPVLLVNPY